MHTFIDQERAELGVEPICRELQIAASGYYEHRAREADPERRPPRVRRDEQLRGEVRRVYRENHEVYGSRKVWHQLRREGREVARCTVELRRSLTWDQGSEMAEHAQLRIDTALAVYFCDPRSPWQCGNVARTRTRMVSSGNTFQRGRI
jgi:hypothetical protein